VGGGVLLEVTMPEPITIALAVSSAVLAPVAVIAMVAAVRHRDPIGRAVAGHADLLGALRDTAIRSAKAPTRVNDRSPDDHGVSLVPSGVQNDSAES
jgi:hypothetical protein